jgi:methionine sulfoxide reductase heme-binding subunit
VDFGAQRAAMKLASAAGWTLAAAPAVLLAAGLLDGAYAASPWRFAVRETGLWAMRFTVLALLISPLLRFSALGAIEPWRRAFGLAGALYGFAHLYFWTRQYGYDWPFLVEELARPFLALGLAAALLMVPLAATSNNRARLAMGILRWRQLHLLVYPAALTGWLHYALAVRLDRTELYAQAVCLALALVHRVLRAFAKPPSLS